MSHNNPMKDQLPELFGEVTGRRLISVWTHFPQVDMDPNRLVDQVLQFNAKFPSDILKIPIHGRYCVVDFGCVIEPGSPEYGESGSSSCKTCIVNEINDWEKIDYVDPLDGHYGQQLQVVKSLRDALPNLPLMLTVFSPTMVMRKLSMNQFVHHFVKDREKVLDAFKIVNKVTIEFMNAAVDFGVDGIFMATQEADLSSGLDRDTLTEIIKLNSNFSQSNKGEFSVLHIHGEQVLFKEAIEAFQPTAVNWHDDVWPTIEEARSLFKGGLLAGISPDAILQGDTSRILELTDFPDSSPLILAPNCVLLQGTKEKTLNEIYQIYRR
ncbi:MAG: hypothetical protein D6732_04875 [Methanobacteriota archaeon]|nr:MAG: hypothetical protein D6732_04875 [Euryarchaeota archaeon]